MKTKILWFAPYSLSLLQPELELERTQTPHACSWIVHLANELAARENITLHIATNSSAIWSSRKEVLKYGIWFHVIRHAVPFTVRGFPEYCRADVFTNYVLLRRRFRKIADEVQPDLIHVHGTEYGYGLAGLDAGYQTIISIQGLINKIRLVEDSTFLRRQSQIELEVIKRGAHFGTRTEWASEYVKSINSSAKIYYLPEAVNPVFFGTRGGRGLHRLLYVGGLQKRKGIEVLLDALPDVVRQFPDVSLCVAGTGDPGYVRSLKRKSEEENIRGHVVWFGSKDPEEIAALHDASTLLVHPTFIDNSPNAVAEAMASGLPVVASNVGGIPSMIKSGDTGILVEQGNPRSLSKAITDLLGNAGLRSSLSANAQRAAKERHQPEAVADQTLRVYADILEHENKRKIG